MKFLVCPYCIDERSQGGTLSANPGFEAHKMRSGYFSTKYILFRKPKKPYSDLNTVSFLINLCFIVLEN